MSEGAYVGIDLGTTYSLVAVVEGGVPRVLENRIGELLTPSAVSLSADGTLLVGAPARARATTDPDSTALWFKRDMGTDRVFSLGARKMRPEELSALVLAQLKQDAEAALGREVHEAVVTVPAYFGELARRATRDACEIAGLHVERIVNEPTAAALAYGLHERERELRAVVLDLGGGTFDVTVLEIIEQMIEIQASSGDSRLGGEDFADLLTEHLAKRLRIEQDFVISPGLPGWPRLREAAERAKLELTESESARLALPGVAGENGQQRDLELQVTRVEAEELWAPVLSRLEAPIRRALADAGVSGKDLDEVILVGGATRMPCLIRLASTLFGRLPLRALPADEAVALGAAVQAAMKAGDASVEDMVVTDIAPFTLGTSTMTEVGDVDVSDIFAPIIERGTVLPTSRTRKFVTGVDGQTVISIEVYQGEHSMCRDNQKLGEYAIKDIPPKLAGEESIEVRFTYDLNGLLEVDTTVVSTKQTTSMLIEKAPGLLSPEEISRVRAAMQRLKLHPRDALPNVTALNRAEALHVELAGRSRRRLGGAIATFNGALESHDPKQIDVHRYNLIAVTQLLLRER